MMSSLHQPGTQAGPWKLLHLIGKGVWAAVDKKGQPAAVKVFKAGQEKAAEQEFLAGKSQEHPNLLQPVSFSVEEGIPLIAMPLCKGRSTDNVAGFFSEAMAWKLLLDISSALSFLHAKGLCHGDVKPSNILWDGQTFLLADFGSCFKAPTVREPGDDSSWRFAAPEREKSFASDIWSLGATLFNLVMGTQVFNGMGGQSQREDSGIPFMRKSMPELSRLVIRCLHFKPEERPSASAILAAAQEGMHLSRPASRPLKTELNESISDTSASFWPEAMKDSL